MKFQGPSGEVLTANDSAGEEFVRLYAEECKRSEQRQGEYIKFVRAMGAQAAIRNDGWVDRENNTFQIPSYAYFVDEELHEGGLVAIGDESRYMMARVTKVKKGFFGSVTYHFKETSIL